MIDTGPGRLVIGLGNPGPEYAWTRHNLGFHVIDRICEEKRLLFQSASQLPGFTGPRSFEWAELPAGQGRLVKPMTFMNRSGKVVGPLAHHLLSVPHTEPRSTGKKKQSGPSLRSLLIPPDFWSSTTIWIWTWAAFVCGPMGDTAGTTACAP
jgi:hypothetical protein